MNWRSLSWKRLGCLGVIGLFAAFGALVTFGLIIRESDFMYVDQESRSTNSPDGELRAYQVVTRGGLGTVWTTRLYIADQNGGDKNLIYSNRDSDFEPPFRWEGDEQLRVFLPCGRIDHLGNQRDYGEGETAALRVKVRFSYIRPDCGPGSPTSVSVE